MGIVTDSWKALIKKSPGVKDIEDLSSYCKDFDEANDDLTKAVSDLEKAAKKLIAGGKSYADFFKDKANKDAKDDYGYLVKVAAMGPKTEGSSLESLGKKLDSAEP